VLVDRRQVGCLRFCYVAPNSITPRRYRCQPDLAVQQTIEKEKQAYPALGLARQEEIRSAIQSWVVPAFRSERYGDPSYAQLTVACPRQISAGAEDEAEMGAFHFVKATQRLTNLAARLQENLPVGLEVGVFLVP
jgi:hypothetical protein